MKTDNLAWFKFGFIKGLMEAIIFIAITALYVSSNIQFGEEYMILKQYLIVIGGALALTGILIAGVLGGVGGGFRMIAGAYISKKMGVHFNGKMKYISTALIGTIAFSIIGIISAIFLDGKDYLTHISSNLIIVALTSFATYSLYNKFKWRLPQ
jgi:hypothetical protein